MARLSARPAPDLEIWLRPIARRCRVCDGVLRADYTKARTVVSLRGLVRLHLQIRRCQRPDCPAFHHPIHPEAEGHYALPEHEVGLDVLALVGQLHYREHRTPAEIHAELKKRAVSLSLRSVSNALDRYDELVALRLRTDAHLQQRTKLQGRVLLGIDGLQPDVGQEVLWVVRDCLSGEVLHAQALLSATQQDLTALLSDVRSALHVPIAGIVSDGQRSLRKAIKAALPGVPHQLCQYHYLREAARPLFDADRHAKKLLKAQVRGVRALERELEGRSDEVSDAIRGYCAAIRSALTDDHRPPLKPSGLLLHERLQAITTSLRRVAKKGGPQPRSSSAS